MANINREFEQYMSNLGETTNYAGDGVYQSPRVNRRFDDFRAGFQAGRATPPSPSTAPELMDRLRHAALDVLEAQAGGAVRLEIAGEPPLYVLAGTEEMLKKLAPSTAPEVGEREIAELALTRARMLGTAGMEFAAHLCMMGVRTIDGIEYIPRDGVMNEVAAWRRAFDSAPEVSELARRAALASRPAASLHSVHDKEPTKNLQRAEVGDEGLPRLPEPHWKRSESYTAEQFRQGQRDAVAADRARRGSIDGQLMQDRLQSNSGQSTHASNEGNG